MTLEELEAARQELVALRQVHQDFLAHEDDLQEQIRELRSILESAVSKRREAWYATQHQADRVEGMERDFAKEEQARLKAQANAPDLNNPELVAIMTAMKTDTHWLRLRDYQKADLILSWDRFLRPGRQWGIFNANDTSLGKTAETAMTIRGLRVVRPGASILWLTKSALIKSSAKQCAEWGLTIVPLVGTTPNKLATWELVQNIPDFAPSFITNYEALNTELAKTFTAKQFTIIAVDEMHRLRGGANPSGPTKMWTELRSLIHPNMNSAGKVITPLACEERPFPIFMSGSLINNGSEEIWAYLHLFSPEQFPSLNHFKRTYLALYRDGVFDKSQLMDVIGTNFFRKTKAEIGLFMNDKIYVEHLIELEVGTDLYKFQKELISSMMMRLEAMGDEKVAVTSMLAEMHYQRISLVAPEFDITEPVLNEFGEKVMDARNKPVTTTSRRKLTGPLTKLDYIVDHVFELVMGEGENVILCSAAFNHPIAYLMTRLRDLGIKCDAITGNKQLTQRDVQEIEEDFQQNRIQVLFLNLKSGAEGLNLNKDHRWPGGSSHVGFIDKWWNPQINMQGEDRAWRVGCPEPVSIHLYQVVGSADMVIAGICEDKLAEAEDITEHHSLRASEWREKIAQWMKA